MAASLAELAHSGAVCAGVKMTFPYCIHLIKYHQFIFMGGEVGFWVGQFGAVCAALKIEIY
jgi:hypothetical protein